MRIESIYSQRHDPSIRYLLSISRLGTSHVHRVVKPCKLPCPSKRRNFEEIDSGETDCRTVKSEELLEMLEQSTNIPLPTPRLKRSRDSSEILASVITRDERTQNIRVQNSHVLSVL